jgi:prefoldin alpha subunit
LGVEKAEERDQRIEALVSELGRLEDHLRALQQNASIILQEINEIKIAKEALEGIKKYSVEDVLISIDRRGHVYLKGSVSSRDIVLAHIGGEYLAEVSIDDAMKILDDKESELRKALETLNQEMNEVAQLYERLQNTLVALLAEREKSSTK